MTQGRTTQVAPGDGLTAITKRITQPLLDTYATASGDHNPLHTDPQYAAATQFGGTIAHGMLLLAFISEMLTASFGRNWVERGRIKVRFRAVACPGDEVIAVGRVLRVEGGRVTCEVECRNGAGELIISGEAEVPD